MRKIRPNIKKLLNIIVCVYMVLIIAVMPFYYTMGYGRIGSDKYDFFYSVTTKAGGAFLVVWGIYVLLWLAEVLNGSAFRSGNEQHGNTQKENARQGCDLRSFFVYLKNKLFEAVKANLSRTDIFALIYGAALVLSYLHTDYKEMTDLGSAWNGATGWYMGFTTQIMFLGVYFAVSRFWRTTKVMPALWLPVTFIVFALGYLNRFSVYPIKMEYANSAFISTIGNINWYCGYTVAVFFVLLYYWWSSAEKIKWVNGALLTVCAVGFGTLVTQGSNSGHLTLAVMCVIFYLLSIKDGRKMQRFWLMVTIMGGSLTATALFRLIFPGKFSSVDAVTKLLTYSVVPVILLAAGLVMWKLVGIWNQKGAYPVNIFMKIGKVGVITALAGFVLVMILIVVNTLHPGSIGKLSELGLFTFNMRWGSSRGATYMAGMQVWLDQDFVGKLLGVGPDSMAMYIHKGSNPELLAMVEERFGGNILTNAHCEWLTILADVGVLGLIGFGGMIASAVARYIKSGKSDALIAACGMGILAYTINNVFSFQQAMGTTTMFLILGMGEAFVRAGSGKRTKTGEYHGRKSNQLQNKYKISNSK